MELTSLELNNTIVRLRKVVGQAKYRVTGRLIRRIKELKRKKDSKPVEAVQKKSGSKLERYLEDVGALKKLKPDDVSKFALLNTKTLQELKITGKTPASDRVLYKVATNELIVSAIEEFREKYPEWHREVPFMLQRLGMQYKFRKGDREVSDIKNLLKTVKLDEGGEEQSDGAPVLEKPEESLLAKVKRRRKEEKLAKKKRREAKMKKLKAKAASSDDGEEPKKKKKRKAKTKVVKSKKARRSENDTTAQSISTILKEIKPVTIPEGRLGQMEIRRLRIDSETDTGTADKSNASDAGPSSSGLDAGTKAMQDPFFMDGDSADQGTKEPKKESKQGGKELNGPRMRMGKDKSPKTPKLGKEHSSKHRSPKTKATGKDENDSSVKRKKLRERLDTSGSSKPESSNKQSLHPSWEAKRKQKLLQQSVSSAPAAKKIKFD